MPLRRRRLLALTAGLGSLSACSDPFATGTPPSTPTDTQPRASPTAEPTATDEPTPTPKPAAAVGCPDTGADRLVCSVDPPADGMVFEPDPAVAELPRVEIACRIENETDEVIETNFYRYGFHRYRDGRWYDLVRGPVPLPLHRFHPGETHVRRVTVDNTDLGRVSPPQTEPGDDVWATSRIGLGPGAYAIGIAMEVDGVDTSVQAAFTLHGDPVPLVEPDTVADVTRRGSRSVVHVDPMHESGDTDRFTLTVRADPDPLRDPRPLVDEQLYLTHYAGLRAAFAHLVDDGPPVEVRGDDSGYARTLAGGRGARFFRYRGETYRVRIDPYAG